MVLLVVVAEAVAVAVGVVVAVLAVVVVASGEDSRLATSTYPPCGPEATAHGAWVSFIFSLCFDALSLPVVRHL